MLRLATSGARLDRILVQSATVLLVTIVNIWSLTLVAHSILWKWQPCSVGTSMDSEVRPPLRIQGKVHNQCVFSSVNGARIPRHKAAGGGKK